MHHKTLAPMSVVLVLALALTGCVASADLVPVNSRPDIGELGFCKLQGQAGKSALVVVVKNQGNADAPASTTTIEFSTGESFSLPTPAVPIGGSIDLSPLDFPKFCFNPDCEFTITVDSSDQIKEGNEENNSVDSWCIG